MEKRFEESFNELGLIYEAYYTTNKAEGQTDTVDSKSSLRKGQFTAPGSGHSMYQANLTNTATAPVSDEEKEVDPIIVKLEELQKEAEADGMDYAVLQLATLKKFIEES